MLASLWKKWKILAEKIGNFQFAVIFSILYYLLVFPIGIISSLFGDLLRLGSKSGWIQVEDNFSTLEKLKEQ